MDRLIQETDTAVDDSPVPSKRRRVTIACDNCRERKIRCDGGKPACGPCKKRKEAPSPCIYTLLAGTARRINEPEHIASLQRKIEELQQRVESEAQTRNASLSTESLAHVVPRARRSAIDIAAGRSPVLESMGTTNSPRRRPYARGTSRPEAPATSPTAHSQYAASNSVDLDHSVNDYEDAVVDDYQGPSPISAMGAAIPIYGQQSALHQDEFYGRSSILSLAQEVTHSEMPLPRRDRATPQVQRELNYVTPKSKMSNRGRTNALAQAHFALPPREIADKLLDSYFSSVHIFYPWVSFREEYDRLWTVPNEQAQPPIQSFDIGLGGSKCTKHIFFCALNAMFAIGCQFTDFSLAEKENVSSVFFGRMKDLLNDAFDGGSISHVQALLLAGHYLLCTQYPSRCWNIVGTACRMAVGLGLHSSKFSSPSCTLEAEIRRRVWYGCYQLDMTVSMTLGRPAFMRTYSDVPLPSPIDDEYMKPNQESLGQPDGLFPIMTFTGQNIKLAQILGQILDRIYHSAQKHQTPPEENTSSLEAPDYLHTVGMIDASMQKFMFSLPNELNWNHIGTILEPSKRVFRRQANVLHARYLHLKILLLRPSLTKISRQGSRTRMQTHLDNNLSTQSELMLSLYTTCAVSCVRTACVLIESIQRATTEDATGAWWYSMFYLVTCAIIIVSVELSPSLSRHLERDEIDRAWEMCLAILQKLENRDPRAQKYVISLNTLRDRARTGQDTHPHLVNNFVQRSDDSAVPMEPGPFHDIAIPPRDSYHQMNLDRASGVHGEMMNHHQHPSTTATMENILDFTTLGLEQWESGLGEFILSSDFIDDSELGINFPSFI